jgi:hypothetical protein
MRSCVQFNSTATSVTGKTWVTSFDIAGESLAAFR